LLLLEQHRAQLPDLSRAVVLLPHGGAVPRFRRLLGEQAALQGHQAVLPPVTATLCAWVSRFAAKEKRCLSAIERELLLLDLLNDFPLWRDHDSTWPLIDSLLALFDELNLHQCRLPVDAAQFLQQIAGGIPADIDASSPMGDEARLVHALWNAWQKYLLDNRLQDQATQTLDGLAHSLKSLPTETKIYIAGYTDFTRAEIEWLQVLRAKGQLVLLLQGNYGVKFANQENPVARVLRTLGVAPVAPPQTLYADFLDRAFAQDDAVLLARAQEQKKLSPSSPAHARLVVQEAGDAESEARAIDIQVRRWRLQGLGTIGIVTHDRKLARRVRALLERANIELQDAGGWALSTTSAATALARWLECLERQFAHQPLLDLLKSPFVRLTLEGIEIARLIPVFEQAIVRSRNVSAGLAHYRAAIERATADLQTRFGADVQEGLKQMLTAVEEASAGLSGLTQSHLHPAADFLSAIQKSLDRLGLSNSFRDDDAGSELMTMLDEMKAAATRSHLRLTWPAFLRWLRRHMEQRRFHPPLKGGSVELTGLVESRLCRYDALIIAGAVREHLPGHLGATPFFNDSVRTELGLPGIAQQYASLFHDFRRLLDAAPRVMITLRREQGNERLTPSPWVERLRAFHEVAYSVPLNDPELEWLVQQPEAVIAHRDAPMASPTVQPSARLPAAMQPSPITATDHQRLLDCPYQYFCSSGLGLQPEKDVREEMEKMDFGIYVHRILQAFHSDMPHLPGPWNQPLTEATMAEAEKLLLEISQAVFASDLRRHFFARGWLYRWTACIPAYLKWEQERATHWRVQATELKKQRDYQQNEIHLSVAGRIDRLDRGTDGYGIIDYKTGAVATRELIQQGEAIQLPFYSLLLEDDAPAQATFLLIQDSKVAEKSGLDGDALASLRAAILKRLMLLTQQLNEETPLPAWGDEETCRFCEMESLCRREMWTGQIQDAS
jgi:ATP-dependent helicase/nuclease subunit B